MPSADTPSAIDCDALVIGAGPVGLFQVFQLGLQGVHAEVVDALPVPGGQCIELYADKPIYDIPAVQVCTGRELVERLLRQIAPFAPRFHLGQEVSALAPRDDGRFDLRTSAGQAFIARSVFIAGGVGAFQPRQLKVDGIERHVGRQVFYRLPAPALLAGRQVLVVGGEDAAVDAVLQLADASDEPGSTARPARITLLHRRATLTAEAGALARLQAHVASGLVHFEVGQILGLAQSDGEPPLLTAVQVIGDDDHQRHLATDLIVACLGVSPKLGPIATWGLALERRQLVVDAAHFETSTPGIFAVGDVVTYPGKKKLILCGFHEATLAAFAAAARLRPDQPVLLQYTTTSPRLHQLLGVATPAKA
ncbi:MAG: NAD(P)/FAD-dependent oxidoreductase [Aquabacterium sp.]|nr:NAD(P)/FAD-dependent oxidoreductase [Aquabacterium sp.]